ncbi:MAG TPA: DUF3575 domain-containing protein [Kofleriaceae bacterium]|nr:DUF3575 domain-containing protein [Kofleriaceae bacterium]
MRVLVLAAVGLASLTSVAAAQPVGAPPYGAPYGAPPPPVDRSVSVTLSPLHLLFPMLELTAELRAAPRWGVAAIGGVGSISADSASGNLRFFAVEVGASARYYATGSFRRGVQVGAEVTYVHLTIDEDASDVQVTGAGRGLSIGAFAGYKWTGRSGLTLEAQGGLAYLAADANASDSQTSASDHDSSIYPLVNANIGWSF